MKELWEDLQQVWDNMYQDWYHERSSQIVLEEVVPSVFMECSEHV